MLTPFPTQTPGYRTVRSPTPAPSWMTTNGETATSLPMIAEAFESFAWRRYFGLERNVTWPGPASSIGEMPVTTTSPSPTSRAPIRTARSASRTSFPTGILLVHQIEHLGGDGQRGMGVDDPAAPFEQEVDLLFLHDLVHLGLDDPQDPARDFPLAVLHLLLRLLAELAKFGDLRVERFFPFLPLLLAQKNLLLVQILFHLPGFLAPRVDFLFQLLVPVLHLLLRGLAGLVLVQDLVDVDHRHLQPFPERRTCSHCRGSEHHCNDPREPFFHRTTPWSECRADCELHHPFRLPGRRVEIPSPFEPQRPHGGVPSNSESCRIL